MQVVPPPLARLIREFNRLPGIGEKTATRLALYLLRRSPAEARGLAEALAGLHENIRLCSTCFAFSEHDPCVLCADPGRDRRFVCVVEDPGDLIHLEKTGAFRGLYHILHGVLSPIDGIGPEELKIHQLEARVARGGVKEILLGLGSTVPSEATASFLLDRLAALPVRVTRLARGIPMGMDVKYADEHTLARAIENRQAVK